MNTSDLSALPSVAELAQANRIKAPRYSIHPGQTLKLEGCTAN